MSLPTMVASGQRLSPRLAPLIGAAAAPNLTETTLPKPAPSRTASVLRRLQLLVVAALLVVGIPTAVQLFDLRAQLASAPELSGQYTLLTTVEAELVEAQTVASLRLAGVPTDELSAHLGAAAVGLVSAAAQRPEDQQTMADISQSMLNYAALLRGSTAAQLAEADNVLVNELRPSLATLRTALQNEATQRSWSFNSAVTWVSAALCLAAVILASVALARRSHRVFNLGVVIGLVASVVIALVGLAGLSQASAADSSSRDAKFKQVVALADGRIALADLRHLQSRLAAAKAASQPQLEAHQTLITRLDDNKKLPRKQTNVVVDQYKLGTTALTKRDWTKAAGLLADAATVTADQDFTEAVTEATQTAIAAATDKTTSAVNTLLVEAIAVIVLSLVGALAGYLGINRRLKEYR